MPAGNDRVAEFALIQQCLSGDQSAWHQLYRQTNEPLLHLIAEKLGHRANEELAEEIAARVWASLIFQDGKRLRAFDPQRGRLLTFLAALARQQIQRLRRPRSRKGRHEVPLLDDQAVPCSDDVLQATIRDGFLATLTRQELKFWHEHLMPTPGAPAPPPLSPANYRKLKQRVFKKLHNFLYGN